MPLQRNVEGKPLMPVTEQAQTSSPRGVRIGLRLNFLGELVKTARKAFSLKRLEKTLKELEAEKDANRFLARLHDTI